MLFRPFRRPPVSLSEKIGVRSLRALRLDTMSGKVLMLAVLAALVTALAMTLILSGGSQRSLGDRVALELRAASSDAAREIEGVRGLVASQLHRHRGVRVSGEDGVVSIELHLDVDWGTRLPELGRDVQRRVLDYLERMTGSRPAAVNVVIDSVGPFQ